MSKKDEIALSWERKREIEEATKEAQIALREARAREVEESIAQAAPAAVETLVAIMESEDAPPIVRVAASKDLLDRAGFKPVERSKVEVTMPKPILDIRSMMSDEDVQ